MKAHQSLRRQARALEKAIADADGEECDRLVAKWRRLQQRMGRTVDVTQTAPGHWTVSLPKAG